MRRKKSTQHLSTIRKLLMVSATLFLLHALTFLFMSPAAKLAENNGTRLAIVAVGIVFWATLLVGYAMLIVANVRRKEYIIECLDGDLTMGCRIGLITFCSTFPGMIADAAAAVAIIAFLINYLCGGINGYFSFILLAILSFSLHMHGILNGRTYKALIKRKEGELSREKRE